MVLVELGSNISRALQKLNNATIINDQVLNECVKEICRSLLHSDVRFELVRDMQINIKKIVNLQELAAGLNKRRIIEQAVYDELCRILDPGKTSFTPKKGQPSVIMFVGLQGSGKTTTCIKYAYYRKKKGWKPALVCADTFRAGAFDQLKQNATKAAIPFHGSYSESDPVQIAAEGVERFKKENHDLIIVDTSGRHKQEEALFEEMRQVFETTKPDRVIFVMDSSIGQAAYDQALAFKQHVAVGAVIVTKMDGHAKGGGALSAVAATKSPVIFIGNGEHMNDFEVFNVKPFVSRLLGKGDLSGLADKIHEVVPVDQQPELLQRLSEGNLTMRSIYELYQKVCKMGPVSQVFSMLPRFSAALTPEGHEKETMVAIKQYMTMMDSMTNEELDSPNLRIFNESRIMRIARGSGRGVENVMAMLHHAKMCIKNMKVLNGGMRMGRGLPPQLLAQLGGRSGLQSLMKRLPKMQ